MIRTRDDLIDALAPGRSVARGSPFDGLGAKLWAIVETGETVRSSAIRTALERGDLTVIRTGIDGEAYQLGKAPPPQSRRLTQAGA